MLAPLVDPEHDPWVDIDGCFEILLDEGWSWQQAGMWVNFAFLLKPDSLATSLRKRRN